MAQGGDKVLFLANILFPNIKGKGGEKNGKSYFQDMCLGGDRITNTLLIRGIKTWTLKREKALISKSVQWKDEMV